MLTTFENPNKDGPAAARLRIRNGWSGLTTGFAPGFLQGNLVILPASDANPFVQFCEKNPQACPILGVSKPGEFNIPRLSAELDLRTDVGAYRIYHRGVPQKDVTQICDLWRDDFVAIVLGCWFSAEARLADAGIRMRHLELGIQGALFRTTVPCESHGQFHTNLVVSMRPFDRGDLEKVSAITAKMPLAHGAPIHIGEPAALGIRNLATPDFGEQIIPLENEVPVFWPCGVTASEAAISARSEIAITHIPGRMVITDLRA